MIKALVIVESPSKSKTIEKYLGSQYSVVSSKGHIRDLSTSGKYGFGVDIDNNFKPNYIIIRGKKKTVDELKKEVKKVDKVILATDPDREGEAISWHLKDALNVDDSNYERVIFNEITKEKVIEAFNNPRKIDDSLVKSQEARRILDRIIGFRLSKLMQNKTGGKSAGRVQSVALKLIVDREREIEAFVTEEYWSIVAKFKDFEASLEKFNNKKIDIHNELEAKEIKSKLSNAFKIDNIEKKAKNKKGKMPFITSTLQQDASNKLNFSANKTMNLAQKLYEGIKLKDETVGLITYMRTDSTRLSSDFINNAFQHIATTYGKEYLGAVKVKKDTNNVQDAHEAIRPTSVNRTPDIVKPYLTNDEYKLYHMIYTRALASLMKDAKVSQTIILLDNNGYTFKATGQELVFDGYLKIYANYEDTEDKILPPLEKYHSSVLVSEEIELNQHFTKPQPRFTEARLIKEMEELGIGRPSTYAKIIDTLKERDYVLVVEKKFKPTEIGVIITDKLQEFFKDLINVEYTAKMESDLDNIADGGTIWYELLEQFYKQFEPNVKLAFDKMEKKEHQKTGEDCPLCAHSLIIRKGKYGEFVACSNFPNCKYIKSEEKQKEIVADCPKCEGKIIKKQTKKGKIFYGCDNYPKCNFASWDKPIDEKCANCGSLLVENKNLIKCSSCDFKR